MSPWLLLPIPRKAKWSLYFLASAVPNFSHEMFMASPSWQKFRSLSLRNSQTGSRCHTILNINVLIFTRSKGRCCIYHVKRGRLGQNLRVTTNYNTRMV
nr:uncharacterized protein LOC104119389 [Nicotiana tomentosiformis]